MQSHIYLVLAAILILSAMAAMLIMSTELSSVQAQTSTSPITAYGTHQQEVAKKVHDILKHIEESTSDEKKADLQKQLDGMRADMIRTGVIPKEEFEKDPQAWMDLRFKHSLGLIEFDGDEIIHIGEIPLAVYEEMPMSTPEETSVQGPVPTTTSDTHQQEVAKKVHDILKQIEESTSDEKKADLQKQLDGIRADMIRTGVIPKEEFEIEPETE